MNTKFYFDFRDIFRAGRLGFKGKKMMMHFLGLMLGYLIYEALTYLSLVSSGAGKFWATYGLRPVCPFESAVELSPATIIVMAIGASIWVIIYYLFSTAVSKVAVEELRGDDFYTMKQGLKFACKHWKSIFVTMLALIGIFILCLFFPSLVGLLDLIPGGRRVAVVESMEELANILNPKNEAFQKLLKGCRCNMPTDGNNKVISIQEK